jgi:hypothetical protein
MVSDATSYDVGFGDADGFDFWGFSFLCDNWMIMVGVEMVCIEFSRSLIFSLWIGVVVRTRTLRTCLVGEEITRHVWYLIF